MPVVFQNVRFAFRVLCKNPGFLLAAVLSLALGIGANTAIFSVVNTLLLKPLPVYQPHRLVGLFPRSRGRDGYASFSYLNYRDFSDRSRAFLGLIAYGLNPFNFSTGGQSERIWGNLATANYFSVLGIQPRIGRFFLPDEERTPGGHPVAVISHGLWVRRFGADPAVLGRRIILNSHPFTVVGVAPKTFQGAELGLAPDIWIPIMMQPQMMPGWDALNHRGEGWLRVIGRLKPDAGLAQVREDVSRVAADLAAQYPESNVGMNVAVIPDFAVLPQFQGAIRSLMMTLLALVSSLLLLACVNVAGLMLSRMAARAEEVSMRLALGASRSRIIGQLLTESVLVALAGGAGGLLLALWLLDLIARVQASSPLPSTVPVELDGTVLAFTMFLSLGTGLIFGLTPAWHATRCDVAGLIKTSSAAKSGGIPRLRSILVIVQIGLALILLIASGLFIKSFQNASVADPGFASKKLLLASLDLGAQGYDQNQSGAFLDALRSRLESQSGVEQASICMLDPLGLSDRDIGVYIEGAPVPKDSRGIPVNYNAIDDRFLRTMAIPLSSGRDFDSRDRQNSTPVVIVNETMARRFWNVGAIRDVVGKRISLGSPTGRLLQVVGVAHDTKYFSVVEHPIPYFYVPLSQNPSNIVSAVVNTSRNPEDLLRTLERTVHGLDRSLPVYHLQTMTARIRANLALNEFAATLLAFFGVSALLLAGIGLYGVLAYVVEQRTREVGIRLALGAPRSAVLALVLRQGLLLAIIGIGIGGVAALALTAMLKSQLFGVAATDPSIFAMATLVLGGVAILACVIPSWRSTRIDPIQALHYE